MSATSIPTGTLVRSFDFPKISKAMEGEDANYIEGVIIGQDEGTYEIVVTRAVYNGENQPRVGYLVCVQKNGRPCLFGGETDGVEAINDVSNIAG